MGYKKRAIQLHKKHNGKIEIKSKVPVVGRDDLSMVYTPGVAGPCKEIVKDKNKAYDLTMKGNFVGIVSDGSAVLGLGNIGPEAALPVMEGKAIIFKKFVGLDAFPICLDTQEVEEIVKTVKYLAPNFAAINLEDISAPRCFEIEERLQNIGIPVMHDDQHGTAVVVFAGLINALKVVKKDLSKIKVIIAGAGAAGVAILKLLQSAGMKNVLVCDSKGIICSHRKDISKKSYKQFIIKTTNDKGKCGNLSDALDGVDVFIGVSGPNTLKKEWIKKMTDKPIIFAMANPNPEILPEEAIKGGAYIIASGRSDYPNQINNALAYPGIFKGAIKSRVKNITPKMKIAASYAIANLIKKPGKKNIIPSILNKKAHEAVVKAVIKAAK
jgi:malate dehydrogenase (oxaloacetate-decarboxylating)